MASLDSLVREVIVKDSASAVLDRVAQALDKTSAAEVRMGDGAATMEQKVIGSTRGLEAQARSFEALRKAVDPIYAKTLQLADIQAKLNKQVELGVTTATEAGAVYTAWAAKINGAASSVMSSTDKVAAGFARMGEMGRSQAGITTNWSSMVSGMSAAGNQASKTAKEIEGLSRVQRQMFLSAGSNAFSSLVSGAPLRTIALQQGSEIADAFAMGEQGIGGTLKALGSSVAGGIGALLNPVVGITAALGVMGVTAVYALTRWQSQQDKLTDSLQLLGRQTGLTTEGLDRLAMAGAGAGGLSNSEGRTAAAQFAGAGLSSSVIQGLVGDTKAFARATGTDLDQAGKNLAKLFKDPASGAKQLAEQFGGLTAADLQLIDTLQKSGQQVEAQDALFARLDRRLKQVKDTTWTLKTAWDAIVNTLSNAGDAIARGAQTIAAPTLQQQYQSAFNQMTAPVMPFMPGNNDAAKAEAERLSRQRRQQEDAAQLQAARDFAAGKGIDITDAVNGALPALKQQLDVTAQSKKLTDALGDPKILDGLGISTDELRRALEALNKEKITANGLTGKEMEANDLALKSIQAYTAAEREAVAVLQAKQTAEYAAGDATRRSALEEAALAKLREQNKRDADNQLRSSQNAAALTGLLPFQRQQAEIEQQYRDRRIQNGNQPGYDQAEQLDKQAAAQAAIIAPFQSANLSLNAQIRLLTAQQQSWNGSTEAMAAAGEKARLLNELEAQGIPITENLTKAIDDQAGRYGKVQAAADEYARTLAKVQDAVNDTKQSVSSMLDTIENDIIGGKSKNIFKDLLKGLGGDALKAGNKGLMSALFEGGSDGKGLIGGALGGLYGGILGLDKIKIPGLTDTKAVTAAMMTVTATSVVVNGGVSTGLGGLPGAANSNAPGGSLADLIANPTKFWQQQAASGDAPAAANAPANAAAAIASAMSSTDAKAFLQTKFSGSAGGISGLNDDFASRLAAFLKADPNLSVFSGYRSYEHQAQLFAASDGSGKWVAPPGHSQHEFGNAADLRFGSQADIDWAHQNAAQYGLEFPMSWENWHVQPMKGWQGQAPGGALSGSQGQDFLGGSAAVDQLGTQVPNSLNAMTQSANQLTQAASQTTPAVGDLGKGIGDLGSMFGSLGSVIGSKAGGNGGAVGGGIGSIFGTIFKGLFGGFGGGGGTPTLGTAGLFANGGIMTSRGPLPLNMYAGGGIADRPQVAVFGEGRGNEAYVPLPDGRSIPVTMRGRPRAANQNVVAPSYRGGDTHIHVAGDVSENNMNEIRREVAASEGRQREYFVRNFGGLQATYAARFGDE